jgi:hypothetical protein
MAGTKQAGASGRSATERDTTRSGATTRGATTPGAIKRATTKGATTKRATTKGTASKGAASKRGASKRAAAAQYTDPALRERLKRRITAGTKGGRAGQWSARKAQLLAHEYEAHGGGYAGPKSDGQRHLEAWTHEEWTTADGAPARRGGRTARYLPKQAWEELTPAERRSTDRKKREASPGRQFVANTPRAAAARRRATGDEAGDARPAPAKRATSKRATSKRATSKRATSKRATSQARHDQARHDQAPGEQARGEQAARPARGRAPSARAPSGPSAKRA